MRFLLTLVVALSGCTCRREQPGPAGAPDVAPSDLAHDLELQRIALLAFGNSIPLPVSEEFNEEVPQIRPALERAAAARPNQPLRLRVARDVPFGQVTRLMQAGLGFRVLQWELQADDGAGTIRKALVRAPTPTPRGSCWSRSWVGPDGRVVTGIDVGAETSSGMTGVLVNPLNDRVRGELVVDVVRRMDARCTSGDVRIYSQASARIGPVIDLARAFQAASPPPKLSEVVLAVPSIGQLDSIDEVK